jgi:hypothetical protein
VCVENEATQSSRRIGIAARCVLPNAKINWVQYKHIARITKVWGNDMGSVQRKYSKEEFARRGDAVYEREVRPHLKAKDKGKFVAVDIESGAYEIAKEELAAIDKLRARVPDAQTWLVRVGSPYVYRFGNHGRRGRS